MSGSRSYMETDAETRVHDTAGQRGETHGAQDSAGQKVPFRNANAGVLGQKGGLTSVKEDTAGQHAERLTPDDTAGQKGQTSNLLDSTGQDQAERWRAAAEKRLNKQANAGGKQFATFPRSENRIDVSAQHQLSPLHQGAYPADGRSRLRRGEGPNRGRNAG